MHDPRPHPDYISKNLGVGLGTTLMHDASPLLPLSPFPPSNPEYHALAPEVPQALSTRHRNRCVYLKSRGGKFNLATLASTLLRFIPSFGNRDCCTGTEYCNTQISGI